MTTDYNDMPDWMRPVDTMQEHYDYEENARYDRFDGWGDPDLCEDEGRCYECYEIGSDCPSCAFIKAWNGKWDCIVREDQVRLNRLTNDPTSPHYIPF